MATAPIWNPRAACAQQNTSAPAPAFDTNSLGISGAGAAVTVTLDADASRPNVLYQIAVSYSAAPAAGVTVKVNDGSTEVFRIYPDPGGAPLVITFDPPRVGTANTAMTVVASAAGGTIVTALWVNALRFL